MKLAYSKQELLRLLPTANFFQLLRDIIYLSTVYHYGACLSPAGD